MTGTPELTLTLTRYEAQLHRAAAWLALALKVTGSLELSPDA